MEDLLRLGLWSVAGLITFLILFEAWRSHRRHRLQKKADKDFMSSESPDDVLGLHAREPSFSNAGQLSFAEDRLIASSSTSQSESTQREVSQAPATTAQEAAPTKAESTGNDVTQSLLVINVHARQGQTFNSYDLLQAISATGMQYGDMNIFHYEDVTPQGKTTLFSLASATKPGYFDLDRIGDFSCVGLTLFTNLQDVPDARLAFDLMLQTAEQLAEDLDGELRATPRTPWNETVLNQYQQKVSRFQTLKTV